MAEGFPEMVLPVKSPLTILKNVNLKLNDGKYAESLSPGHPSRGFPSHSEPIHESNNKRDP